MTFQFNVSGFSTLVVLYDEVSHMRLIDANQRRFAQRFCGAFIRARQLRKELAAISIGSKDLWATSPDCESFSKLQEYNRAKGVCLAVYDKMTERANFYNLNRRNYAILRDQGENLPELPPVDCDCPSEPQPSTSSGIKRSRVDTDYDDMAHSYVETMDENPFVESEHVTDPLLLYRLREIIRYFKLFRLPSFHSVRRLLRVGMTWEEISTIRILPYSFKQHLATRVIMGKVSELAKLVQEPFEEIPLTELGETVYNPTMTIDEVAEMAEPQMERAECAGPVGDEEVKIEKKSNVILTTHAVKPVAKTLTIPNDRWENLCVGSSSSYNDLMRRPLRYPMLGSDGKQIQWNTNQVVNTMLLDVDFPYDFVKKNKNSPNCVLFDNYALFKSDLTVTLTVNTNKFCAGQLRLFFYYGASTDKYYKDRMNVYSASQMLSTVVDAGCANSCELKIPYRYYKPFLGTCERSDDKSYLSMGRLGLVVMNRLSSADTNYFADLSMFVTFDNPRFAGMKPRSIPSDSDVAEPQMFGLKTVVKTTANLLDQLYPDEERDNPPDVMPPKPMVPWSAHSWCVGDVLPEPVNPFRLVASGQTPHPPGTLPIEDEQSIKYICQREGLVKQFQWKASQAEGTLIIAIPFSPSMAMDAYYPQQFTRTAPQIGYYLPPIAFMSKLFSYWRGAVEYKLDFIATQFHTGRLIVGFVPRVAFKRTITVDELTHCDHVIFDLYGQRQLRYVQSYVADKPWWPINHNSAQTTETYPPGYIYVMVLNRLAAPSTVAQQIDLNLYIKAGPGFELAIPCAPRIGHVYNTDFATSTRTSVSYVPAYGPPTTDIGMDTWGSGNEIYFRYGSGGQHVTQFEGHLEYSKVYKAIDGLELLTFNNITFAYLVRVPADSYIYGAPFQTPESAKLYADSHKKSSDGKWVSDLALMNQTTTMPNGTRGVYNNAQKMIMWVVHEPAKIEAQAGDQEVASDTTPIRVEPTIALTNQGHYTFGENFRDIRQLCRRYQPYAAYYNQSQSVESPQLADFYFPVMPQGLELNIDQKDMYSSLCRDGVIPLLSSGYRFYRGSVRYRIVFSSEFDLFVWVQHRPEYPLKEQKLVSVANDVMDVNHLYNPGFASLFQGTAINGVVEFEVPFYLPGQFGLLQRPDTSVVVDAAHYSMGRIYCGVYAMGKKGTVTDKALLATVFYSIGDDMSFSVFQGFPPVMDLSIYDKKESIVTSERDDDDFEFVEPQMELWNWVSPSYYKKKIDEYRDNSVRETLDHVKDEFVRTVAEEQAAGMSLADVAQISFKDKNVSIAETFNRLLKGLPFNNKDLAFALFSQLVHAIINPSFKTMLWAAISSLVQLGLVAQSALLSIIRTISRLVERLTTKESERVEQQMGDHMDELHSAVASTCVAGMLSVLGATSRPIPSKIPDFATYLNGGVNQFTKTANGLSVFFSRTMCMFKAIYFWLVRTLFPDQTLNAELAESHDDIINYVHKIQFLLDERNSQLIRKEPLHTASVYQCASVACMLQAKAAISTVTTPKPMLMKLCNEIIKLRDTLSKELLAPPIRFEPFVLALVGPSNVGKSYLSQVLVREMLSSIGYKTYNELIYTRTPGNAYWNTLNNQPFVLYDDFMCIQDDNMGILQAAELFCLKSKAVFNPPMAAIEDKNVRYNPIGVILASNIAFPTMHSIADRTAFWRRRDFMVEVDKRKAFLGTHPRNVDKDIRKVYGHLKFRLYNDPSSPDSSRGQWMDYQTFLSTLLTTFHDYYNSELQDYMNNLTEFRKFYPEASLDMETCLEQVTKYILETNEKREPDIEEVKDSETTIKSFTTVADMSAIYAKRMKAIKKEILTSTERKSEGDKPTVVEDKNKVKFCPMSNEDMQDEGRMDYVQKVVLNLQEKKRELENKIRAKQKEFKLPTVRTNYSAPSTSSASITVKASSDAEQEKIEAVSGNPKSQNGDEYIPKGALRFKTDEIPKCSCASYVNEVTNYFPRNVLFSDHFECLGKDADTVEGAFTTEDDYAWKGYCDADDCALKKISTANILITRLRSLIKHEDLDTWPENFRAYYSGRKQKKIDPDVELDKVSFISALKKKLPELWGKALEVVLKLAVMVGAVYALVKLVGCLFAAPKNASAEYKKAAFNDMYHDTNLAAEKEINVYVKQIASNYGNEIKTNVAKSFYGVDLDPFIKESQANAYAGQTIGSPITKTILAKAVQNLSSEQESVIISKIFRNTFFIIAEKIDRDGTPRIVKARCIGLAGFAFLSVDHYWYEFNQLAAEGATFRIVMTSGISMQINYSDLKLVNVIKSAMVIGRLPKTFPMFANIIKFIIPLNKAANLSTVAYLITINYDIYSQRFIPVVEKFDKMSLKQSINVENDNGSTTFVDTICCYPKAGRGLCGSILITDLATPAPIIGMHIAGIKDTIGYSELIVKETFLQLLDFELSKDDVITQNLGDMEKAKIFIPTNVAHLGVVKPSLEHHMPKKESISKNYVL
ncbi:MAG: capsid protein [Sanya Iflavirus 4]|nr:MAG: capsid protein [Sanya Iflavirus 4]